MPEFQRKPLYVEAHQWFPAEEGGSQLCLLTYKHHRVVVQTDRMTPMVTIGRCQPQMGLPTEILHPGDWLVLRRNPTYFEVVPDHLFKAEYEPRTDLHLDILKDRSSPQPHTTTADLSVRGLQEPQG